MKTSVDFTLKYFPANSCTPMIANISQKMRHTSSTLKMEGIACTSAFTTTCHSQHTLRCITLTSQSTR